MTPHNRVKLLLHGSGCQVGREFVEKRGIALVLVVENTCLLLLHGIVEHTGCLAQHVAE